MQYYELLKTSYGTVMLYWYGSTRDIPYKLYWYLMDNSRFKTYNVMYQEYASWEFEAEYYYALQVMLDSYEYYG